MAAAVEGETVLSIMMKNLGFLPGCRRRRAMPSGPQLVFGSTAPEPLARVVRIDTFG
jgi:hypothetical protein